MCYGRPAKGGEAQSHGRVRLQARAVARRIGPSAAKLNSAGPVGPAFQHQAFSILSAIQRSTSAAL